MYNLSNMMYNSYNNIVCISSLSKYFIFQKYYRTYKRGINDRKSRITRSLF